MYICIYVGLYACTFVLYTVFIQIHMYIQMYMSKGSYGTRPSFKSLY